jgi:very-short-patch-repair endonuclease
MEVDFVLLLRNLPIRILRQKPIDRFIVDFYCAAYKIAIEVDGEQHYIEDGIAYDAERSATLSGYGIDIIRFTKINFILKSSEAAHFAAGYFFISGFTAKVRSL